MNRRLFVKGAVALAIVPGVVLSANKPRLHTFSNLVGVDGKPITVEIYPEQEASFATAGRAGRHSALNLDKLCRARRD